ncbi:hypothetical protein RhiTH_009550 [Rhizoctonia solani]
MRQRMFKGEFNKWRVFLKTDWRDKNHLRWIPKTPGEPNNIRDRIASVNINGFKAKQGELHSFIVNEQISICALQETLVRSHLYPVEVTGFTTFVRHHKEGFRGQALLVKNSYMAYEVGKSSDYYIHVKVNGVKSASGPVHIIAVYLPSGNNHGRARRKLVKEICQEIAKVIEKDKKAACVIMGDFNYSAEDLNKQLKPSKSGLSTMNTKGSALTRFPKSGWCRDLDHIVVNSRAMSLLKALRVMRKYELSDHRPILAEFRKLPNESPSEQKPVKWDMGQFKLFAKEFVNHNRWAVLSKAVIETGEELSKVTDQMAKTLDLVAEDLSLKTQPNNLPPMFKKKLRKLLKRKNTCPRRL